MKSSTQQLRKRTSRSRHLRFESLEVRMCLSTYTTVDLMPLEGHDYSLALGVNDDSLAVGNSSALASGEKAAVVWSVDDAGVATVQPLPGFGIEPSASAKEVNNDGMIAGEAFVAAEDLDGTSQLHATVWTGSPGNYAPHDLGTAGGDFVWSRANDISEPDANGNVWVVGISGTAATTMRRGFLWQVDPTGNALSVIDLEPDESNVWASDVEVIGDSVLVAGDFPREDSTVQACVWEVDLNGQIVDRTDLGTPEFNTVTGYGLNQDGDVVGYGFNADLERNAYFSQFPHDGSPGSITDLGSLGNNGSRAVGINDHDVVVGRYCNVTPPSSGQVGDEYAFVWENGVMHDLLDQVSDKTFWLLYGAFDINNNGEIVGHGRAGKRNDSQEHGFLARPEGGAEQHAPVANGDSYNTLPDTTLNVAAPGVLENDTDADGDPISAIPWNGVTANGGEVALHSDGSFSYIPDAGFTGTDTFTYTITDGTLDSDPAEVSIDVSALEPTAIYVYDIRFESIGGGKFWRAVYEIRSDSDGDGLGTEADAVAPGVAITAEFAGEIYSGTTDADGVFRTDLRKNLSSGEHYAEVVDLALANYFWDPLAMDLEDDTDGDGNPDEVLVL